jgi:hypothetical protein
MTNAQDLSHTYVAQHRARARGKAEVHVHLGQLILAAHDTHQGAQGLQRHALASIWIVFGFHVSACVPTVFRLCDIGCIGAFCDYDSHSHSHSHYTILQLQALHLTDQIRKRALGPSCAQGRVQILGSVVVITLPQGQKMIHDTNVQLNKHSLSLQQD